MDHDEFDLPFEARMNPHAAGLEEAVIARVSENWRFVHPDGLARFRGYRTASFAVRAWPAARREDLEPAAFLIAWHALSNDYFDGGLAHDAEETERVIRALRAVTRHGGSAERSDVVTMFASVWRDLADGMSPGWLHRARRTWDRFLRSYASKALRRARPEPPSVGDYLGLRARSTATATCLLATERFYRHELPDDLAHSRAVLELRTRAEHITGLINDVFSVAKDERAGERHNVVLLLQGRDGGGRSEAISRVRRMTRDHLDGYLSAEADALAEAARRPGREANRDVILSGRDLIRASLDWRKGNARFVGNGQVQ
jgi:hypothetical protein